MLQNLPLRVKPCRLQRELSTSEAPHITDGIAAMRKSADPSRSRHELAERMCALTILMSDCLGSQSTRKCQDRASARYSDRIASWRRRSVAGCLARNVRAIAAWTELDSTADRSCHRLPARAATRRWWLLTRSSDRASRRRLTAAEPEARKPSPHRASSIAGACSAQGPLRKPLRSRCRHRSRAWKGRA